MAKKLTNLFGIEGENLLSLPTTKGGIDMATEKQIKYFLFLAGKYEQRLKIQYAFYNKENESLVSLVSAFKRSIERNEEISKHDISYVISELQFALQQL